MEHIRTIIKGNLQSLEDRGCRECQTSCQSACKTSCTVGNQLCRRLQER
ncbi:MAG: six-cysteine peptide SCIFF [Firmicutes bacterium]|nr:six-cysteine peptide SCIFF [Bacillota bacterium]